MTDHGTNGCVDVPRAEAIARLNDILRTTGQGGTIVVTHAVSKLTGFRPEILSQALADYDGFDPDNDPHGERDFGDLTLWGTDLLFKVDYYDQNHEYASDDPANPDITNRVLTVMTAADW